MKSIINGGKLDYGEQTFKCDNCECEYTSDEYTGYVEYSECHLFDVCPKCKHKTELAFDIY